MKDTLPQTASVSSKKKKAELNWQNFTAKVYPAILKMLFDMWWHYSPYSDPCGSCSSPNPKTPVAPPQPG